MAGERGVHLRAEKIRGLSNSALVRVYESALPKVREELAETIAGTLGLEERRAQESSSPQISETLVLACTVFLIIFILGLVAIHYWGKR